MLFNFYSQISNVTVFVLLFRQQNISHHIFCCCCGSVSLSVFSVIRSIFILASMHQTGFHTCRCEVRLECFRFLSKMVWSRSRTHTHIPTVKNLYLKRFVFVSVWIMEMSCNQSVQCKNFAILNAFLCKCRNSTLHVLLTVKWPDEKCEIQTKSTIHETWIVLHSTEPFSDDFRSVWPSFFAAQTFISCSLTTHYYNSCETVAGVCVCDLYRQLRVEAFEWRTSEKKTARERAQEKCHQLK